MDFNFSEQEQAFRAEVREFIAEHLPAKEGRMQHEVIYKWNQALVEKKWILDR